MADPVVDPKLLAAHGAKSVAAVNHTEAVLPAPQTTIAAGPALPPIPPIPAEFNQLLSRSRDSRLGPPQEFYNKNQSALANPDLFEFSANGYSRRIAEKAGAYFGVELLDSKERLAVASAFGEGKREPGEAALMVLLNRSSDLVRAESAFRQGVAFGVIAPEERQAFSAAKTAKERIAIASSFGRRIEDAVHAEESFSKLTEIVPADHLAAYRALPPDQRRRIGVALTDLSQPNYDGVLITSYLPESGARGAAGSRGPDLRAIAAGKRPIKADELPAVEAEISGLRRAALNESIALTFAKATIERVQEYKLAGPEQIKSITNAPAANQIEFGARFKPVVDQFMAASNLREALFNRAIASGEMKDGNSPKPLDQLDGAIAKFRNPADRQSAWSAIVGQAAELAGAYVPRSAALTNLPLAVENEKRITQIKDLTAALTKSLSAEDYYSRGGKLRAVERMTIGLVKDPAVINEPISGQIEKLISSKSAATDPRLAAVVILSRELPAEKQ